MEGFKRNLTVTNFLVSLLIISNLAVLLLWKPWALSAADDSRSIKVSGEATVKAVPDEYLLNVSIQKNNQEEVNALGNEVTAKLKQLGVAEKDIKIGSQAYYYGDSGTSAKVAPDIIEPTDVNTLTVAVTLSSKELAQKVQDYLLTLKPMGQVSPSPVFSKAKEKQLKNQARTEALKDARGKAESAAAELRAKLGDVLKMEDSEQKDWPVPYISGAGPALDSGNSRESLPIQPGENELTYNVTVTFALR